MSKPNSTWRRHNDGADGTARTSRDCTRAKTLWAKEHSKNKWPAVSKEAPQKQSGGTDDMRKDKRRRSAVRTTPWASNQEKSATWRSNIRVHVCMEMTELFIPNNLEKIVLCYTSQLKYVFRLEENVSRVVGQNSISGAKLINSLGKQWLEFSTRT